MIPPAVYLRSLALIALYRLLPPRRAVSIAAGASRVNLGLRPRRRELIAGLLKPFVPEAMSPRELERYAAMSRTIRHIGARTYAPVFRRTREWLGRALRPEGLEHLEEVKRTGGAIIVSTHAGCTEWVGPVLRQLGYPLRLVQRRHVAPETLILMRWEGVVGQVLPYPEPREAGVHLKTVYDVVKGGAWVHHPGDYPDRVNGLKGRYLGCDVRCARAPWILARLTGRPAMPALILMDANLEPKLFIGEPIRVAMQGDAKEAMSAAFQTYLDFASARVSQMPWNLSPHHRAHLIPDA